MRYVLLAAHTVLLAVACREILSSDDLLPAAPLSPPTPAPVAATAFGSAEPDLEAIDGAVNELMTAIQKDARDLDAMSELARLYMRHGWWEQAAGPLARAVELAPGRDDLWHQLQLALELGGLSDEQTDLSALSREFAELAAMWGHGC